MTWLEERSGTGPAGRRKTRPLLAALLSNDKGKTRCNVLMVTSADKASGTK